jgi:hypothetical protein
MDTCDVPSYYLYDVADSLGIELHDMGDRFRGFANALIEIGPFSFESDISIISDVLEEGEVSFFIKIVGSLWLYFVKSDARGLQIHVVDGSVLKLHVKDMVSYGAGSVVGTLKKMERGLITEYGFDVYKNQWVEFYESTGNLDNSGPFTDTIKALPSPKEV